MGTPSTAPASTDGRQGWATVFGIPLKLVLVVSTNGRQNGWRAYPKMVPLVLTHSQLCERLVLQRPP